MQQCLSQQQFEICFKRKWIDWYYRKLLKTEYHPDPSVVEFLADPSNIDQKLEIRFIDDRCGWGLFATGLIKEGEVISLMTGEIDLHPEWSEFQGGYFYGSDKGIVTVNSSKLGILLIFFSMFPLLKHSKLIRLMG